MNKKGIVYMYIAEEVPKDRKKSDLLLRGIAEELNSLIVGEYCGDKGCRKNHRDAWQGA